MGIYRLTEDAKSDLLRIYSRWLREYGEVQADRYYNDFFTGLNNSRNDPLSYPAVDDIRAGYRRSVCGADSIYYRVQGDTVEIMAIVGQQDLDNWL